MNECDQAADTAERYVSGTLPEPERTSFEEHFFSCSTCFRAVQALEDARGVLAGEFIVEAVPGVEGASTARARAFPPRWMAMAATVVVVAGLALVIRRVTAPIEIRPNTLASSETLSQRPETPAPTPPSPAQAPLPAVPRPDSSRQDTAPDRLERWADVVPPQYVALTTRTGQEADDQDARMFDEAMTHYSARRYSQAAERLQALNDRAPSAHVQFFLGISELMSGEEARAGVALQLCAAQRTSPYSDEAHFYLAKLALRAGGSDLTAAVRHLEITVERGAGPTGEAARLLEEIKHVRR
jgi:Putative zinc-finger